MRLLIWGIVHDKAQDGPAEEAARIECASRWGSTEDCLVIDICGLVMLNTAGVELENMVDGLVDAT